MTRTWRAALFAITLAIAVDAGALYERRGFRSSPKVIHS